MASRWRSEGAALAGAALLALASTPALAQDQDGVLDLTLPVQDLTLVSVSKRGTIRSTCVTPGGGAASVAVSSTGASGRTNAAPSSFEQTQRLASSRATRYFFLPSGSISATPSNTLPSSSLPSSSG